MSLAVRSVGLDFCFKLVLSAVSMVNIQPDHSTAVFQQSSGTFFHIFQVQRWCHHLVHIVLWIHNKFLSTDEEYSS